MLTKKTHKQREIVTMRKAYLENLTLKGHIKGQRETADKVMEIRTGPGEGCQTSTRGKKM